MAISGQNTYAGPTIVAGGTLQLAAGSASGINGAGWTIENVSGNAATISGGSATLTSGGSTFNNVWCNNPLTGLTTQPWTASFTYSDIANGGLGALSDGGQFILQTAGPTARTTARPTGRPSPDTAPRPRSTGTCRTPPRWALASAPARRSETPAF